MHRGPNWSALRMPFQFFTGWGSRQRRSPSGGRPNGIPLKLRTPSLGAAVDSRMPFAVVTRSAANSAGIARAQIAIFAKIEVCMGYRLFRDGNTGCAGGPPAPRMRVEFGHGCESSLSVFDGCGTYTWRG